MTEQLLLNKIRKLTELSLGIRVMQQQQLLYCCHCVLLKRRKSSYFETILFLIRFDFTRRHLSY